jgi:GAF domain-containing protein
VDALRAAGDLAATPFTSRDEATAAVLDLIGRMTGLRTPFLARTDHGQFEVVAVDSRGDCPLAVGRRCRSSTATEAGSSGPCGPSSSTTRATAPFRDLAVTADLGIGSYVGVPIVLSDGQPYGTLCAIDPDARSIPAQTVDLLRLLSRFIASRIDEERLAERLRASEARYRRVFESVQDVFYQTDAQGLITEISPSVTSFSAYRREELIGRPATCTPTRTTGAGCSRRWRGAAR